MASFHSESHYGVASREIIPEEDSFCCSSTDEVFENDLPLAQAGSSFRGKPTTKNTASKIIFWRNLLLAFVAGTTIVLATAAFVSIEHWDDVVEKIDPETIPYIATAAIVVSFGNVCGLIVLFTYLVQKLLQTKDETPPVSSPPNYTSVSNGKTAELAKQCFARRSQDSNGTATTVPINSSVRSEAPIPNGSAHIMNNSSRSSAVDNLHDFLLSSQRESQHSSYHHDESCRTMVGGFQDKPIAELFPETTIMFADIEGFTAWSSTREPSQVFVLLETLYHAFDVIAAQRKVFKVETVGDCYVAVTGLPEPRKDHALIMCKFAKDCLKRMRPLCRSLVVSLGPDTCDLNIRIGVHSGPVTGGVLRGERSRFQLFGDTVNTASRIETTGQGGRIHLSTATADLLKQAGKGHWVTPRPSPVLAKGKGALSTYWLSFSGSDSDDQSSVSSFTDNSEEGNDHDNGLVAADELYPALQLSLANSGNRNTSSNGYKRPTVALNTFISASKRERLVAWNVDILHRLLKQIVARRQCLVDAEPNRKADADESIYMQREGTLLDEVKESIELPDFNYSRTAAEQAEHIELDPAVYNQLQDFVKSVSKIYPDHPFHNFEHASHVTMSVTKLLSRIVAPTPREVGSFDETRLHDHTFGITSDPLTQFSCVLAALLHDADHPGVPNAQLVKEGVAEVSIYKGKSVAEQNSLDRCFSLLMSPKYKALRRTIYTTDSGLRRFRSLLVNAVMATDICDADLKKLRNAKWEKAFAKKDFGGVGGKEASDRKATIVIEHLMQASDVAHTMQHWHIYRKWNERLFRECYKAYREGRAERDPSEYWYEGEKGFFDFYIIPLAKKLQDCGVFGVSSSEYLDYALRNREEWELKGREVVEEMVTIINEEETRHLSLQSSNGSLS